MYKSKSDLPETLRKYLPEDLQEVYLETYQKAWEGYEEDEGGDLDRAGVAHRDAMTAIEENYVHDQETGKWYPKDQHPKKGNGTEKGMEKIENVKEETGVKNE